jgi:hypothetical protein
MLTFALQTNWKSVTAMTARFALALRGSGRELFDFSIVDDIPDRLFEETSGPRFLYGSSQMVRKACEDSRLRPDIFFTPDAFDQRTWVANCGDTLLNAEGANITWAELRKLTVRETVFVRPTFDQKSFAGALVGPTTAQEWFKMVEERNGRLNEASQVWVSSPKPILAEYRFIVLDHELVTGSRYRADDRLAVSPEIPASVYAAAQRLAGGWLPARFVTMDVAVVSESDFRIVEFNSIHSSGLYHADILKVIEAAERAYLSIRHAA